MSAPRKTLCASQARRTVSHGTASVQSALYGMPRHQEPTKLKNAQMLTPTPRRSVSAKGSWWVPSLLA